MERGFESWFQNQKINWQSRNPNTNPNPNPPSSLFGLGPRATIPCFGNTVPTVHQQPYGWFYGLPRHRQGVIPAVNKEQVQVTNPDMGPATNEVQKKFLVFDQSGDQTTLIYSSGVGPAPIRYQFPLSNNPKPQFGSNPFHIKENDGNDSKSEMREDTEELNALLYSDDDYENENDYCENEETSTGHSPNSMMFLEQKGQNGNEKEEEVASSGGDTKKRKREDGGSIVNSLEDTASSGESGVGNDGIGMFEEELDNLLLGNKRLRKEKMKETINLLHDLIPGDKIGKSAIMVIDEAICYLRSLKVKAKALGLDSL